MATAIHVNGPALIKVALQYALNGTPNGDSLNLLGITENGPLMEIEYFKTGVIADTGGDDLPVEYQRKGKKAKITFALPIYDDAVLSTWILGNQKGTANEGTEPQIGDLIFANNLGFRLVISSPIEAKPYRFYWCTVDFARMRPGTKYKVWDIGVDAIAYIGNAQTAKDTVLYDNTEA